MRRLVRAIVMVACLAAAGGARAEYFSIDAARPGEQPEFVCGTDQRPVMDLSAPAPEFKASADDSDGDGVPDTDELSLGIDPFNVDSDCDGVLDAAELNRVDGRHLAIDTDGDGIGNVLENAYIDSDRDGITDTSDANTAWQVACGKFAPYAVTESETTTFSVRAISSSITRIVISPRRVNLELFDDGSNGDLRAGDRVFSRGGIGGSMLVVDTLGLHASSGASIELSSAALLNKTHYNLIVPAAELVPMTEVSPGVWASRHAVALVDSGLAAQVWGGAVDAAARRFVQAFGDDYDFIQLYPNGPGVYPASGVHRGVRNAVTGIGISVYDQAESRGLTGPTRRLKAVHWLQNSDLTGSATLHEVMHLWQAFAGTSLGLSQCSSSHWGIAGQGRGVMGGFDPQSLVETSPGLYEVSLFSPCCGAGNPYTRLELYFAGLAAASEVPPIVVPMNTNCASLSCDSQRGRCQFRADGLRSVSMAELVALTGPRSPAFGTAPTRFSVANVLVSDRPPTPAELSAVALGAKALSDPVGPYSFSTFSGGRGSLVTDIHPDFDPSRFFRNGFEN